LRYREERCERMSREACPWVGEVRRGRMRRAIPQEHLSVRGEVVRGRGHSDRAGVPGWYGVKMDGSVVSSGLRLLVAHDQARWVLDLEDVGGGHERPDAQWGVVWRAVPGEGVFVIDRWFCVFVVLRRVHVWISKWVARELSGREFSKL
jgi:hypothetical protein